uniref:Uncharacterized protein n=1 Tax=Lygus hesperus TaxID=30085 RepID=A0A0K8TJH4_LYGHE
MSDRWVRRAQSSVVTKMFPLSKEVQTDPKPVVEKEVISARVQANLPKLNRKGPSLEHRFTQVPDFTPNLAHVLVLLVLLGLTIGPSFWLYNEIYVVKRFSPMFKSQSCCICKMASSVLNLLKHLFLPGYKQ